jgi:hypothetical protein
MIGAAVQNPFDIGNFALQLRNFLAAKIDVADRNLRIDLQSLEKLPQAQQVDIEGRFDHAQS